MYRWFLAIRFLWRRPIMWISVVGVMLGVSAIVVVDSIFHGVIVETLRVVRGTISDLNLEPPRGVSIRELKREAAQSEGVAAVACRVLQPCLIPTEKELPATLGLGQTTRGPVLLLHGIVPEDEAAVSGFAAFLASAPPDLRVRDLSAPFGPVGADAPLPMILGRRWMEALGLRPGDLLEVLTLPDAVDLEQSLILPAAHFRVVGAFESKDVATDRTTAYVPLEALRRFAAIQDEAHEMAIRLQPGVDLETARRALERRLRHLGVHSSQVQTWRSARALWITAVENQRHILDVILFFIVFVAGFNLLVTLNMTLTRKLPDIGILSAMGGSSLGVAGIFVSCGICVCVLGAALGLCLGTGLAFHIDAVHEVFSRLTGARLWREDVYGFARIPTALDLRRIGSYLVATFASTLLFASIASLRAARLDPVRALRRQ